MSTHGGESNFELLGFRKEAEALKTESGTYKLRKTEDDTPHITHKKPSLNSHLHHMILMNLSWRPVTAVDKSVDGNWRWGVGAEHGRCIRHSSEVSGIVISDKNWDVITNPLVLATITISL